MSIQLLDAITGVSAPLACASIFSRNRRLMESTSASRSARCSRTNSSRDRIRRHLVAFSDEPFEQIIQRDVLVVHCETIGQIRHLRHTAPRPVEPHRVQQVAPQQASGRARSYQDMSGGHDDRRRRKYSRASHFPGLCPCDREPLSRVEGERGTPSTLAVDADCRRDCTMRCPKDDVKNDIVLSSWSIAFETISFSN